jgi:hypothetical protein
MEPLFDYEKLDVYRVELAFIAWIANFLGDVAQSSVQYRRELIEQLDRASLSVLLNRVRPDKEMLARVVAMLTRLIDRFDTDDTRNRGS